MTMDPELKLRVEWDEVRSAFVDAKAKRDKDPDGYRKAKAAMGKMRTYWREVGEAAGTRNPTLETIGVKGTTS